MRRSFPVIAVACLVLGTFYTFLEAQQVNTEQEPPKPINPEQWEYKLLLLTDLVTANKEPAEQAQAIEARFNILGQEGWEHSGDLTTAVIFKRLKH